MYDFGIRQPRTGYRIGYRANETNHCPGCGQSHWMIGRMTAECANCGTALPLIAGSATGIGTLRPRGTGTLAAA
ncbi:hypothetical protein P1X14_09645 [Sphingomonas sp. AOB5]|uniref:hypothetical protein n=1 Tax=Sphingomonas sp. AOB5 TaxID=3034017 RepID=UPI0023F6F874|nr:hypothetical protein [Sphingomonas sp. AOB5]MDF7775509.1 hypothetical protein [Sphingomonas sp. AOB5]